MNITNQQPQRDGQSGQPLRTRLTRDYQIEFPFVGAGMGFISMPRLAAAVSNAGGLGVIGNGPEPAEGTRKLVRETRRLTVKPFGLDFFVALTGLGPATTAAHVEVAIEESVPLVIFHFNLPEPGWMQRLQAAGAKVWMQAGSLAQAQAAVDLGVDGLIIQGVQAGGHNKSRRPVLELLRMARSQWPNMLLLAAGGIADGASAAAALQAGADGVWVGTRLLASAEAHIHPEHQRRVVAASAQDTVVTTLFGPELRDAAYRVLRNRTTEEWVGREAEALAAPADEPIGQTTLFPLTSPTPYPMPRFSAMIPDPTATGDFEQMGLGAGGESAGLIHSVQAAGEIVQQMMAEAARLLQAG